MKHRNHITVTDFGDNYFRVDQGGRFWIVNPATRQIVNESRKLIDPNGVLGGKLLSAVERKPSRDGS